ncbi:hypothetical protein [Polyangium mundeleinium]|uniref:RING-type E3 ubiquitin transferase n=1 Tax=Polyangium mundeleinium TaxID=2995306 RepID=A0ABT5ERG1_9BACT|nr:hypothetical protein [Polyangium mundeleinium]MDC0744403.1 hypothetical protein [Polyangium mundeleinium]
MLTENPFQRPETAAIAGALGGAAVFLVGMVAWALGTAFSARREAQAARRALGKARATLAGLEPETKVTLEGVLEVVGEPGARFEDGAPAAAATAAGPFCAANARAPRLRLVMRDGTVDLRGRTRVVAGSREARDGALDVLPKETATRIRAACGARDPLPAGPLRMRSVAHGDRVVVAGRIVQAEEAPGAAGYRERGAPWTLEAPSSADRASEVLRIAFAGSPVVSGVMRAAFSRWRLRKIAPFALQVAAFGAALGVGKATYDVHVLAARADAQAAAEARARKKAAARIGPPAYCKEFADQYAIAMDRASTCTHDNDCRTTLRGEQWYDLDGCFRFENRHASTEDADRIAREWLEAKCVSTYEVCSAQPSPMCRRGHCVERPPSGVPETWVRQTFARQFTFFAPPDVEVSSKNGLSCGPGAILHLDRHDVSAHFLLDRESARPDPDLVTADVRPPLPVRIGRYHAVAQWMDPAHIYATGEGFTQAFAVHFSEEEAVCPPFCLPSLGSFGGGVDVGYLHFTARCRTDAACEEAFKILQTLTLL